MASEKESKISQFDGTNFGFWKMQIEDSLYQKNLYSPLGDKPMEMKDSDWELLDRKALGTIRLSLSKSVAYNIKNEKTTASLMAALSSMYEQPSAANKIHLIKKLFTMTMSEGAQFREHLSVFKEVTDQLEAVDMSFTDEIRACLILGQLPESWKGTVTAISGSAGKTKLKFDDVVSTIMTEEIRNRSNGVSTSTSALNVESRGRDSNRSGGRNRFKSRNGRSQSRNPKNSNNSNQNQKVIECWNCGKTGHYKNQCRSPKKEKEGKTEANIVAEETDDALICSLENKSELWVLDSGASFHATSNKELLMSYSPGNLGKVYLGDDQPCDVVGKGDVQIKLNGSVWKLRDVRHIPDLRKNLISVGQLATPGKIAL